MRRHLPTEAQLSGAAPSAGAAEGAASQQSQAQRCRTGGLDKGGLVEALTAAGIPVAPGVAFADELRLGLRGLVRRVWAPRGVKIVQHLELRYAWRYLVLAVDGLNGKLWWQWTTSMNGVALAPVVAAWKEAGLHGLVWDGAGSQRGKPVRAVGLPTVVQPAASLELNPAERVFEEVRRAGEGRTSPTLTDTVTAVERYLNDLAAAPARIRSLAGWAWIAATLQPDENTPAS